MYIHCVHTDDVFLALVAHNARGRLNCAASCSAPPNPQTGAAHSIAKVEAEIRYTLTDAHLEAVFMATTCGVCVISGGAGT